MQGNPSESTRWWHVVLAAGVLVTSMLACQLTPAEPPTPEETVHSSPYNVMLAMLAAASAGDSQAFLDLFAFTSSLNLKQMNTILSHCQEASTVAVPFDVEYVSRDLAVGTLGNLAGRYDIYIERFEGDWYISEIQGTASDCPF